ncbi:MAG: dehydrogenase/reductase SDR family protein 7B [Flavobacteriales bacterium]|jgi:dehydrogenase/reductase SDR family protein 7B
MSKQSNNLESQTIWITGASSGIGEAIALAAAKRGAHLILSARNEEKLIAVKNSCEQLHNNVSCHIITLDLSIPEELPVAVLRAKSLVNKVDVLVNNGGVSQRGFARDTPLNIDRRIMEINFFGNIALSKAILPWMTEKKGGRIVVISSISGKFGFFMRSAYAASKHALQGFYESLRLEEKSNNINVNIVYPGIINTPISKSALNAEGKKHGKLDTKQANGMPVDQCAEVIIDGWIKNKKEILVGGKELKAVWIKRLFPSLFFKMIAKQSATK